MQNPLSLAYLKLPGPPRGVIVKETGLKPGVTSLIKPRDVILQIDGFDIDAEGNYHDPQYKKLSLENLSSRGKFAGMTCKFKIWRDGKEQDITYKLPRAEYRDELVPEQSFDQAPEYVLTGGFVFVQLSDAYLRSYGPSWRQRAPFRLAYYDTDKVKPDRSQRVVLAQVLPAKVNIGYEGLHNAVIDEVNGMEDQPDFRPGHRAQIADQRLRRLQIRLGRTDPDGGPRRLGNRSGQPEDHDHLSYPGRSPDQSLAAERLPCLSHRSVRTVIPLFCHPEREASLRRGISSQKYSRSNNVCAKRH